MHHSFGHDEALSRSEFDDAFFLLFTLEIDEQLSFDDIEKFIVVLVLVPVVFASPNAHAHDRLVDLAQRLVEPLVCAGVGQGFYIDQLQRLVQDVEARFVGIRSNRISHAGLRWLLPSCYGPACGIRYSALGLAPGRRLRNIAICPVWWASCSQT